MDEGRFLNRVRNSKNNHNILKWLYNLFNHDKKIKKDDVKVLLDRNETTDDKMAENIEEENIRSFASVLLDTYLGFYRENIDLDTLTTIIKELLESEGKSFEDVMPIGHGSYSMAYRIGEKVLKVGYKRNNYNIPNHKRILQPLTRTNIMSKNGEILACIEVTDYAETGKDISEEDVYSIYKELRKDGIIWVDPKEDNIGILRKKNNPNLNGEEWNISPISVGFDRKLEDKPLDKGELVIIDTDHIFREGEQYISYFPPHARKLENRWLLENIIVNREEIRHRLGLGETQADGRVNDETSKGREENESREIQEKEDR